MLYRINRFGIQQTSKVAGIVYFVIGLLVIPFLFLAMMAPPKPGAESNPKMSLLVAVLLPFFYGIIGYLTTALALWIYNAVAKRIGGVELDIVYAAEPPSEQSPTL